MQFRNDIQGLRALAVLSVFLFHINHYLLPGGFLGVDIFFVLSGFLISGILIQKKEQNQQSLLEFYQSRFKRILPAYYFLLLVVSLVVIFVYFNQDVKFYRKALVFSSIFNSNNYFSGLDTYFGAQNSENPLLHTWTLSIEMQFYFILPFLIYFLSRKNLVWITILIILFSLTYTHYQISIGKQVVAMYYSLLSRCGEFMIGVLTQLYIRRNKPIPLKFHTIFSLIGLLFIVVPLFIYNEKTTFPGLTALIPCMGTAILLITSDSKINHYLSHKILVFIGMLSYSIYLWHWPIMALYRYYYAQYEIPLFDGVIITLIIFVLSYFSYYFIEEFWRKKSNKLFWVSSISVLGCFALITLIIIPINEKFGSTPAYFSSSNVMGFKSHGKYFEEMEYLGCHTSSADTLMLIGDSHGLVMKPFLNSIGEKNNFTISIITNDTYPPLPGISEKQFTEKNNYNLYKELSDKALFELENRKNILIIKAWNIDLPYFNNALIELVKKFPNKNFIILSDYPTLNKNPIRINRGEIKNKSLKVDFTKNYAKIPEGIFKNLIQQPNVKYIDLSKLDFFKDAPYYKDTVIYYDQNHLNKFGSEKLAIYGEETFMKTFNTIR